MATKRETQWRHFLKEKIVKADKWKEFNQRQNAYRRQHNCSLNKAWSEVAIEMDLHPQWHEFLKADKQRRKNISEAMKKTAMATKPDDPDNIDDIIRFLRPDTTDIEKEREERLRQERELVQNTIPNVIVEDDGVFNPIRDAEWVYRNMNRLFRVDKALGIERLDEDVLREAPSNAAVGLAAHALRDKSKFYEKYGLLLLKSSDKDETDSVSEEQLIEELDPSFRGLEKYLAEKVPTDAAETLGHDIGKTKA